MGKQKKSKQAMVTVKQPSGIALAANWALHEVLLTTSWQTENELVLVLIARRSFQTGRIAAGSFLIDLGCLGVKQTQVTMCKDPHDYQQGFRTHVTSRMLMAPTDFDLVAKIIMTSVDYAAQWGFKPDPVFSQSKHLLAGADIDACTTFVRTGGYEGKPYFINGPYDNPRLVVNQLMRTAGLGNFHYYVEGTPAEFGLSDQIAEQFRNLPPHQLM